MNEDFERIIEAGNRAPSGDNLQPWRFCVKGQTISIFNSTDGYESIYDYKNHGSFIGHGAVLENMCIAAARFGYSAKIELFPDIHDDSHVADVHMSNIESRSDNELYDLITKRMTNRGKYQKYVLSDEEKVRISGVPKELGINGKVEIIDEPGKKKELARLLSNNEKIIFSNHLLHDGLYTFFRWTKKEAEKHRDGLDIRTLGLSFINRAILWLMRSWPVVRFFSSFGLASIVARIASKTNTSSSAICAIFMDGNSREHFVNGGRVLERVWLRVTQMGLSIQPTYGFILLGERVDNGMTDVFTNKEVKLIKSIVGRIYQIFGIKDKTMVFLFRVGKAKNSQVKSMRRIPEIEIKE